MEYLEADSTSKYIQIGQQQVDFSSTTAIRHVTQEVQMQQLPIQIHNPVQHIQQVHQLPQIQIQTIPVQTPKIQQVITQAGTFSTLPEVSIVQPITVTPQVNICDPSIPEHNDPTSLLPAKSISTSDQATVNENGTAVEKVLPNHSNSKVILPDDPSYILKKDKKDKLRLQEIDKEVVHKFRWRWLYEVMELECSENKIIEHHFSECFVKIAKPGCVLCRWCMVECTYGKRGRVALKDHVKTKKHIEELDIRRCTRQLEVENPPPVRRRLPKRLSKKPLASRISNMEALIYNFIVRNSLPASAGAEVVDIARRCCEDPKALDNLFVTASPLTCNYTIVYRPAQSLSEVSLQQLRIEPFCITISDSKKTSEEETAKDDMMSKDRREKYTFSVVASLAIKEDGNQRFIINNLAAFVMRGVDANSMFCALRELFGKYHLPWHSLMSILWESKLPVVTKNVKTELEIKVRTQKSSLLLNPDADSCFVIHEMAKAVSDTLPVLQ